jgi:hypothetical protein
MDPEDEVGQGETVNSEISESPELTVSTSEPTGTQQESSVNPNWNEALEVLPDDYLKGKLTPIFEKWDRNNNSRYEKVQQEFAPYKALAENKVPFEEIQLAFRLRNEISENPQVIFERLAQHLGVDLTKLNGEQSQGLEDEPEESVNPELAELRRRQDMQEAYLAQQYQREQQIEQQKQETNWYNETKTHLDKLTETYGQFDRNRAVQEALWVSERTGKPFDLETGVKSMFEYRDQLIKTSANNSAPDVFSGTGSMPSGAVDTSKMTDEEVIQYAAARAKAKNGG